MSVHRFTIDMGCGEHTEWKNHPSCGDRHGETSIAFDDRRINLQPYNEQEEAEADVGYEREERTGVIGKDVFGKARYTTESSRTLRGAI